MKKAILVLALLSSVSSFAQTFPNPRFVGKRCAKAQVSAQNLGLVLAVLQRAEVEYKVTRENSNYGVTARGPNITRGQISSLLQNTLLIEQGIEFRATTTFPAKCEGFEALSDQSAI